MEKNKMKTLLIAGMLFSFVSVTLLSMTYMAKDNNYYNMINQYFNISKELYSKLIYLSISKDALIDGMNCSSILFLVCNYSLSQVNALDSGMKFRKKVFLLLICFWVIQAIVYSTMFYKSLYFGKFGFLPDPVIVRRTYQIFHNITVWGNFLTLLLSFTVMLRVALKKEPVRNFYAIKWSLTVIDAGICILYFYMYYSLPDSFLWISRAVGYIGYHSVNMADYFSFMKIIPYLIILFIVVYWLSLIRYDRAVKKLKDEDYVFSSIVASSDISIRVFSHYVKNEILGILSETERVMKNPESQTEGLTKIKSNCLEVYERLNQLQKHSNQLILNRSSGNVISILEGTLRESREFFEENKITVIFRPDAQEVSIFCDAHYIKEVFRNLFYNAAESMAQNTNQENLLEIVTVTFENQIKIQISDTGTGINKAVAGHIFDPFVSTKSSKSNWGIGLSFSKRIINSHGGKVEAVNRAEGGAVFTIYLPLFK